MFPWKPKNNADPHHCCSSPTNSSLNRGSGESTSATGFRANLCHFAAQYQITDMRMVIMYLSAAAVIDSNKMERDYSVVVLEDIFAKPYAEYVVDDSSKWAPSFGSPCMRSHCEDAIDYWSIYFVVSEFILCDKGSVSFRCISSLLRFVPYLTQALIAFPRCNQSPVFCMGEGVLLPLSDGLCVLVNLMSAGNMVCRRDDVAGSISQNTLGIFSISSPCQSQKTQPVFHHLMWQELRAVHASTDSSRHIWCCSFVCQCFETGSKVLSVKTLLLTIFAHRGWCTSSLIGSECYIDIFSWETLVAKQFRNRNKFKAFTVIRHSWLETYRTLTVKASKVFFFLWIMHEFRCSSRSHQKLCEKTFVFWVL